MSKGLPFSLQCISAVIFIRVLQYWHSCHTIFTSVKGFIISVWAVVLYNTSPQNIVPRIVLFTIYCWVENLKTIFKVQSWVMFHTVHRRKFLACCSVVVLPFVCTGFMCKLMPALSRMILLKESCWHIACPQFCQQGFMMVVLQFHFFTNSSTTTFQKWV